MARVFISCAGQDRAIADEVASWLRAADHEPFLAHDLPNGISVGEDWERRLDEELQWADAVIGVVTSSFLASPWCSAEVAVARERGCRLMPLSAEANVVHPLMERLHFADYLADPQKARDCVLQAIDGGGAWPEGKNPFPGLEPFTAAHSPVFFGRKDEAREVGNRLRAKGSTGGVLVIVGPSGCGKSSLLNAAVVPQLGSDPAWLVVPPLVPGTDPLPELTRALVITANNLNLSWSASDVRARLEAGTDGLRRVAGDLLAASPGTHPRRLLVSIDQTEELFTRTTPDALSRFVQLLSDAMTGPVHVVAAMRSEFLDDLRDLPALTGRQIEAHVLAPLGREMLSDIIEGPAKVARLHLDNGLTAQLLADTDSGEALPLLALTLRQLAEGMPVGGTLTLARYHDLGGVRGALTRHADNALAEAVRASGLTEREVLAGLTRLVTVDETGRPARRRIKLTSFSEPLRPALQVFVDRRLLLIDAEDDRHVWLTVAHKALLTEWRPLDAATTPIIAALRTARKVEQAATEWDNAHRPEHYLWDGKRLTATLTTLGMNDHGDSRNSTAQPIVELSEKAKAFLDSTARRAHAAKDLKRRRGTLTITVLSTLLVLALIAAGVAIWQRQQASLAQGIIIARGMVAQADKIRDRDPTGALQFGVAARHFDASPQTHASLQQTLSSTSHFRTLRGHTNSVHEVAFAPDGRTLATTSTDQTVRLWDVSDRDRPHQIGQPLTGHTNAVNGVAFAPDGRTLATTSDDGTVRLWNLGNRDQPHQLLTGHTGAVNGVAFAPDGGTLATTSNDGTVRLWNLSDRDQPHQLGQPLTGHTNAVNRVAFAPDGRTLATTSNDGTVRLWNLSDRDQPHQLGRPLTGHTDSMHGVAFAPTGRTLATTSTDQTVRLWNLDDRDQPHQIGQPLTGHTNAVNGVAFAPGGRTLATASNDGTVRVWDVGDRDRPHQLAQPLTGHTGLVHGVAFAPGGRTLATVSFDRTVRLWNLDDRDRPHQLAQPLTGHTGLVHGVAFAFDGRTLATTSTDRTVQLWDVSNRDQPHQLGQPLTGHTDTAHGVAFAPDGRTLATTSFDQTVRLWDVSDRDRPHQLAQPLTGHTGRVQGVAFAPDGRNLATTSDDQTVRLWDISDRDRPHQLGQPLTGHTNGVYGVAFAPDGRTLATVGFDQTVRLWDVSDRDRPYQLGQPLTGHTGAVQGVTFAPDGRTLATTSTDQTLRLWDVSDRDRPYQLGPPRTGHTGEVIGVAFASDGRTLATTSDDQTVRLWELPPLDRYPRGEIREACLRAGGPLDKTTWDQYAPGVSYHDTCADH